MARHRHSEHLRGVFVSQDKGFPPVRHRQDHPLHAQFAVVLQFRLQHALVRRQAPHEGLYEFSGWYGTAGEFLATDEGTWLEQLKEGGFNTVWAKTVAELDLALPKGGGFLLRLAK